MSRVLGIDLAGTSGIKTGYALIEGVDRPTLLTAGLQRQAKTPAKAEAELLVLIDGSEVDRLAIDAPLTLPPCMTCPSYCRGPDPNLCELVDAKEMWEDDSNPVIRRSCELVAKQMLPGLDPKPTMQLGIITARAVALVRKLENRGRAPASITRGEILEVYPRATLDRLGVRESRLRPKARGESVSDFCARVVEGFEALGLKGVDKHRSTLLANHDVVDGLISAYTGWLYPDGLEPVPDGFNLASGWIWFPAAA